MGCLRGLLLIVTLLLAPFTVAEGIVKDQIAPVNAHGLMAYVLDKNGETLMSVDALVVDTSGIIMMDARVVKKWLEDVSYNLIVKGHSNGALQIDRLLALSAKHGKALASLEMQGRRFDRTSEIGSSYREFIKAALERYKKVRRAIQPEGTVMAPSIPPTPPPVVLPKVPEVKALEIEHFREIGQRMLKSKRFTDAEAQYKKVLEIDPKDHDALFTLALIYTNTGRFEEAETNYKRYYALTGSRQVLKGLGTLYVLMGRYGLAINSLQEFLNSNPDDTDALYTTAIAYMLVGNNDEAFNQYLRLKKVDNKRSEDLFDLLYR